MFIQDPVHFSANTAISKIFDPFPFKTHFFQAVSCRLPKLAGYETIHQSHSQHWIVQDTCFLHFLRFLLCRDDITGRLMQKICKVLLLMEEILHQLICSLSHYLQGLCIPGGAGFLPSTVCIGSLRNPKLWGIQMQNINVNSIVSVKIHQHTNGTWLYEISGFFFPGLFPILVTGCLLQCFNTFWPASVKSWREFLRSLDCQRGRGPRRPFTWKLRSKSHVCSM